jgi:hypothetical protein
VPASCALSAEPSASYPTIRAISWTSVCASRQPVDAERSCDSLACKHGWVETWAFLGRAMLNYNVHQRGKDRRRVFYCEEGEQSNWTLLLYQTAGARRRRCAVHLPARAGQVIDSYPTAISPHTYQRRGDRSPAAGTQHTRFGRPIPARGNLVCAFARRRLGAFVSPG